MGNKPPYAPDDWHQWGPLLKLLYLALVIGGLLALKLFVVGPLVHRMFPH